jgi:hypothetical protein
MAPHRTKTKEALRASELLGRIPVIEGSESQNPLPVKKHKKRGRPKYQKKTVKGYAKPIVEDFEGEDIRQVAGHELQRPPVPKKRVVPLKLFNLLRETATELSKIGGCEDVEHFFEAIGIEDEEAVELIRTHCNMISNLLPRSKSTSTSSSGGVPSTMELYEQLFVHRASSSILYLLRPVEVFQGTLNYNRKKVFGCVRGKGESLPLMSALPGWTKCVEKHPRLLEPELWTDIVKEFVTFHNHEFKTSPFDRHHGREDGDTYATHVEPRLMLWFALNTLQKMTGNTRHPLKQKGDLWRLRHIVRETIKAEIVLSRPPCPQCLIFQEFMEAYTPISFKFIVCKNLGEVKLQENKHRQKYFPLYAPEIEDSESEVELEPQMVKQRTETLPRSRIAVVIRQKSSGPSATHTVAAAGENQTESSGVSFSTALAPQDNSGSSFSTKITVSQATHLQQYYHTPKSTQPPRKFTRQRSYWNEADEEEWEPSTRLKSKSRNEDMSTLAKKFTRSGFLTPAPTPFGPEAAQRAQLHKEHRKRERDGSNFHTPTKKQKYWNH